MILNLPADIYPSDSVASVSGLSGTGAGVGTVLATYLTGIVADHYSFRPVLIVASAFPIVAAIAIVLLVRNNSATRRGLVYPI
jgi:MFS transporter, ACS family, hexuronate transporter